jgi:hypothetical protein
MPLATATATTSAPCATGAELGEPSGRKPLVDADALAASPAGGATAPAAPLVIEFGVMELPVVGLVSAAPLVVAGLAPDGGVSGPLATELGAGVPLG